MRADRLSWADQHHGSAADDRSAADADHAARDLHGASRRGDKGRHGDHVRGRHAQVAGRYHDLRGSVARHARRLMALYRYKAVNAAGDVAAGEIEAANESEIVDRLRDQGLLPMQVETAA